MNEHDMWRLLRERYTPPEWALFRHVGSGTGANNKRTADAVAMNLWPSRGLSIHGFEIKVSRADWVKEMKNPAKAEEIHRYCDYWWIVVPDRKIILDGELPPTWGLLSIEGKGLRQYVEAQKNESAPKNPPRAFLAALLRKASTESDGSESIRAIENAALLRGREMGKQDVIKNELAEMQRNYKALHDTVAAFESASGVALSQLLDRYNLDPDEFVAVLGSVLRGNIDTDRARRIAQAALGDIQVSMERMAKVIDSINQVEENMGRR